MVHRKTVRHFHEVGHLHELTFSCYQRMPLLTNDQWQERLARCVEAAGEEEAMDLVGFVFMPEHVHLLERLTVLERPGKTCFRFWQEGPGFDRNVFSSEATTLCLEYIHSNPARRGLCRRAEDWKWSSARYYLEHPAQQHPGLPRIHGLPEGAVY